MINNENTNKTVIINNNDNENICNNNDNNIMIKSTHLKIISKLRYL